MASLLGAVRDIERLRQILLVLARHGFGEVVERIDLARFARRSEDSADGSLGPDAAGLGSGPSRAGARSFGTRLRLVLEDLGPSFVKLGQILSTRQDLIPPDIVRELEKLQDQVAPVPFPEIRAQVEADLGAPLEELFAEVDPVPLASASIAQVHRARRLDGQPAVIKVQRPGLRAVIERDLDLLHLLARAIERGIPESRIYGPVGLVQEFDRAMTAELDFTREADHAERLAQAFAGRSDVRFPAVDRSLSGRRVLTMEFLDGLKLPAALAEGHDGPTIARVALRVIFEQIFDQGFFHADPHPGNLLVMGRPEAPTLVMLDLGLVGRLSPPLRDKAVDLMVAAVRQDGQGVADALYAIGTPTRRIDRERYDAEVALLAEKYLGKRLEEIRMAALIQDLVRGATKYGLEIPPELIMLGRTLMTVEGVGKELDPKLDVFAELRPLFLGLLRQRYSPGRLSHNLLRAATRFGETAQTLPARLDELLDDLRAGRLELSARDPGLPEASDRLGRRVLGGLVFVGLCLGGAHLVAAGVAVPGYGLLAGAGGWLALVLLRGGPRPG